MVNDYGEYYPTSQHSASDSLCGWKQSTSKDDFDWTRHSGPTSSRNTGPMVDHTAKNRLGMHSNVYKDKSVGLQCRYLLLAIKTHYYYNSIRHIQLWYIR